MATQRVPIVLADGPFEDHPSRHKFALIYDYVQQHYRVAATPSFESGTAYSVLIDRRLTPTGTDAQLGLPCYR